MKTRTSLAMLALLALLFAVKGAFAITGAIYTTDSTCSGVNENIFTSKSDVYLTAVRKAADLAYRMETIMCR